MRQTFALFILFLALPALAQVDTDASEFTTINTPVTIDLNTMDETEVVAPKKKKRKKKVFYGVKTRKGFTQKGYGNKRTLELFYVLKQYHEPDIYIRDIYWYDSRRQSIRIGGKIDKKYGLIFVLSLS